MKRGKFNIVFGGQAGSEAKGKLSAFLVDKFGIKILAGNLSPNAGHTVIKDGRKLITHHVPAGVAGSRDIANATVMLGPASVIRPELLLREIEELIGWGFDGSNLHIDRGATIITQEHVRAEENGMTSIGSTAQGVGEARVDRLMRRAILAGSVPGLRPFVYLDTTEFIRSFLSGGGTVLYEMGQGFDLCLFHGVDSVYCTSRNCTPAQALADMGVPPKYLGDVYAVIRPYPIRVNNRTGSSGPYPSKEITWDEVGKRCGAPHDLTELTTTTKLPRRVFEFSMSQIKRMVEICNPSGFCIQFLNYLNWNDLGVTSVDKLSTKSIEFIKRLEEETGVPVLYGGTGPNHEHMVDFGGDD